MSNQARRHASVRTLTGTASTYNSDFIALFADEGFTTGTFNERFHLWLNSRLLALDPEHEDIADLPGAMQAYAVALGFNNWDAVDEIPALE